MVDAAHARFSPSGAHRWMACPGSLHLEAPLPDSTSSYAAEGTVAHELAAQALTRNFELADLQGALGKTLEADGFEFKVGQDMIDNVWSYVRLVREYAEGGDLLAEQRVDFSTWIDHEGSFGTSDAVIVHDRRLTVVDLKYGMGVRVEAEQNKQLMLYALGTMHSFDVLGPFDEIVMVIHQPRLNHVSEWSISRADLETFGEAARAAVVAVLEAADNPHEALVPGESQCRFCRAKATCPALAARVMDANAIDDFKDIHASQVPADRLAEAMALVPLIEDWVKAVRAEVERRLLAGQPVEGFKLVEGRRGNRAWVSEAEAEAMLKSFRLKQEEMYEFKLISPTAAEKVLKESPRRWTKLESLITRSDGKPSVAPASDKRPALAIPSAADEFAELV